MYQKFNVNDIIEIQHNGKPLFYKVEFVRDADRLVIHRTLCHATNSYSFEVTFKYLSDCGAVLYDVPKGRIL